MQRTKDLPRVWPRIWVQLGTCSCFQGLSGALAAKPGLKKQMHYEASHVNVLSFPGCLDNVQTSKILYQNKNYVSAQVAFLIALEQNFPSFLWKFPRYLIFSQFLKWNHTLKSRGFLREREDPFSINSTENDPLGAVEPTPSSHRCR